MHRRFGRTRRYTSNSPSLLVIFLPVEWDLTPSYGAGVWGPPPSGSAVCLFFRSQTGQLRLFALFSPSLLWPVRGFHVGDRSGTPFDGVMADPPFTATSPSFRNFLFHTLRSSGLRNPPPPPSFARSLAILPSVFVHQVSLFSNLSKGQLGEVPFFFWGPPTLRGARFPWPLPRTASPPHGVGVSSSESSMSPPSPKFHLPYLTTRRINLSDPPLFDPAPFLFFFLVLILGVGLCDPHVVLMANMSLLPMRLFPGLSPSPPLF